MLQDLESRRFKTGVREITVRPAIESTASAAALLALLSMVAFADGIVAEARQDTTGESHTTTTATEADWPQFRGLRRDGVSRQEGLMTSWQGDGPRELWRRPLGDGFSGVAAVGELLVTMEASDGTDAVVALDARNGQTRWSTPLGEAFENNFGNGPRTTPTVVGDRVVAVDSTMGLVVLSLADGSVLWQNDLQESYGTPVPRFGYSSSPAVLGDLVVVDVGGVDEENRGPAIVAFNLADGAVRWSALEGRTGYSSPLAVELGGLPQVVFSRDGPEVISLSSSGEVLWRHPGPPGVIAIPVLVPPNDFFVSSDNDDYGGHRIRVAQVEGDGDDGFEVAEVWENRRMRNHLATSVLVDDHLFGFDNATLQALDATTGDRLWAARGFGKGTLVAGGGLLYVVGDDGTLALIRATGERYEELGRLQGTTGKSWTAPTLAHGRLILRDQDEIVAYDVRQRKDAVARSTTTGRSEIERPAGVAADPAGPRLETILARYAEARGGLERWRRAKTLGFEGTYATFSNIAPFEAFYRRAEAPQGSTLHPGHFRIDLDMLGFATTRAYDAEGPWMVYPLLGLEQPTRLGVGVAEEEGATDEEGAGEADGEQENGDDETGEGEEDPGGDDPFAPYAVMITREAFFEPPLLDPERHGIEVELLEPGDIAGNPTLVLALTFPDGQQETWHLDTESHLEVAIESTVHDFTLLPEPMTCRTFFSDWVEVDGLLLPRHIEREFGSRLEVITFEDIDLDPTIEPGWFTMPEAESGDPRDPSEDVG